MLLTLPHIVSRFLVDLLCLYVNWVPLALSLHSFILLLRVFSCPWFCFCPFYISVLHFCYPLSILSYISPKMHVRVYVCMYTYTHAHTHIHICIMEDIRHNAIFKIRKPCKWEWIEWAIPFPKIQSFWWVLDLWKTHVWWNSMCSRKGPEIGCVWFCAGIRGWAMGK